ncbi:hypothetical protein CA3LBN_001944 [Candidozyma haemuli]|uniref:Uncharacterized protein n=1 Tax=Candidozyma haemuli TaxID=45357 RepID=A0ABX8I355_9ASCO|nr:hypothetical protein CA3LBN_001944 [[Candida] haemuloni]
MNVHPSFKKQQREVKEGSEEEFEVKEEEVSEVNSENEDDSEFDELNGDKVKKEDDMDEDDEEEEKRRRRRKKSRIKMRNLPSTIHDIMPLEVLLSLADHYCALES